jgi:D-alanyl-lipoteichoic acid acyltransferase DltB (MBOAT superfamily)
MDITSQSFVVFVLAAALLFHCSPHPKYRKAILTFANAVFIGSYVSEAQQVVPLLAFLIVGYGMIELSRRRQSGAALTVGLALTLALYIFLKRFSFLESLPSLPFPYLMIGLSYMLFRILHLMVDARSGEWKAPINPWSFFNYTCGFLSLVSGPIQRYQDFVAGEAAIGESLDSERVFQSFARVLTGFVKVSVVSAIANYMFLGLSDQVLNEASSLPWGKFCVLYGATAATYTGYLYYNFSGYMDIVIGAGRLFNQDLPENFNKPFAGRNFLEFWNRWHMTLSDWFKVYLFTPLLKVLATRFQSPVLLPYLGVFAFFVTFLVMGVWHGTTLVFVIYGLLMGAGASINKVWQLTLAKRLGKKGYQNLGKQNLYIYLCRGLTFSYFTLAITCLWVDMDQLSDLTAQLGIGGMVGSLIGVTLVAGAGMVCWDAAAAASRPLIDRASGVQNALAKNLWLASQVLLILTVTSFFHKAPDFVYRAF